MTTLAYSPFSQKGPVFAILGPNFRFFSLSRNRTGQQSRAPHLGKSARIRGSGCSAPRRAPRVSSWRFRRRLGSHFPQHPPPSTWPPSPSTPSCSPPRRPSAAPPCTAPAPRRPSAPPSPSRRPTTTWTSWCALRLFFDSRDGARIDASRRRATGRRGERGRDRHARRATPRRAAFGSTPNASRPRQTDARSRTADGRSDGSRTRIRRTRFLSRFLRVFSIARGGRVVVSPCLSLATMSVSIRAVSVSDLLDLSTHFPFSFA
jgi:hypothetical protein